MATEGQQTISWLFFSPSGRIGRLPYFLGWLFWIVVGCFFCARILAVQDNDISLALWTLALVAAGLVSTVSIVMLTIKRLHDVGYPGMYAICLFIPVLSFVMFVVLCLWPGLPDEDALGRSR
ncbi:MULTISPECIES: DUF805 domain-containing protein [unclassified Rhizobium]|uniref:DUF805 domain-containing protein n=1 Tax=unclassified Rhizobium TaxID=2613769 RepID=UPI00071310FD|nr:MULTISPECIES: DUF805 domain-containing protein [unclassified Rhizobium]KQS90422.1 hypothetical protein ASG50_08230 [Rhizobium sp. Leaf386]KQS90673.1 hypothetical protein ASG42_09050 [Rhizobium sp. Leaf391]KQU10163.1 hypothetical protein ASG68_04100 [Rhizobium sp. Leaf453]